MAATKDFVRGFRLSHVKSISRSGEIILVETTNGKMCMGFYCDSDASHNLYLIHVIVVSKDKGLRSRKLRRCWIKNHMIRNIYVRQSNEDSREVRNHANEEMWNNGVPRFLENETRYCENVVMLSKCECSVDLARVTCDKEEWGCVNDDEEWEMIDDLSESAHLCDRDWVEATLHYTGIHIWKHITPGGKPWDANAVYSVGDADVMNAVMDMHWGGGIIVRDSRACHS